MNAEHISRAQRPHEPAAAAQVASEDTLVCALLDGELSEADLSVWLGRGPELHTAAARGQVYQLIGESLRGQAPLVSDTSSAFLLGVQARLRNEPSVRPPATAAIQPSSATQVTQVRAPAANDAVFRWKLVAGLASLAAVMAVSWTVLGSAPAGSGVGAGAPQLALSQPTQATPSPAGAVAAAVPLVVNTRQGVLIRDAGLEALMAEHRQHGGVSALQMPAGFLRNATYDPDAR